MYWWIASTFVIFAISYVLLSACFSYSVWKMQKISVDRLLCSVGLVIIVLLFVTKLFQKLKQISFLPLYSIMLDAFRLEFFTVPNVVHM